MPRGVLVPKPEPVRTPVCGRNAWLVKFRADVAEAGAEARRGWRGVRSLLLGHNG